MMEVSVVEQREVARVRLWYFSYYLSRCLLLKDRACRIQRVDVIFPCTSETVDKVGALQDLFFSERKAEIRVLKSKRYFSKARGAVLAQKVSNFSAVFYYLFLLRHLYLFALRRNKLSLVLRKSETFTDVLFFENATIFRNRIYDLFGYNDTFFFRVYCVKKGLLSLFRLEEKRIVNVR